MGNNSIGESLFDLLEKDILASDITEAEKNERLSRLLSAKSKSVSIMFVGATGSGKSSTINSLFNMELANVGMSVNPETKVIKEYRLGNLTVWDTPGLGDNPETDENTKQDIMKKLSECNEEGESIIDLVMVILDSSSRDFSTLFSLLNDVIVPCFGKNGENRILIGLNQADIAMKGRHWNADENMPEDTLVNYLKNETDEVEKRIKNDTGLEIRPVYYSAGYSEKGKPKTKPYNMTKLLYYIMESVPAEKRMPLLDVLNPNKDSWLHGEDFSGGILKALWESILNWATIGVIQGAGVGNIVLGVPGEILIGSIGGVIGGVIGAFKYGISKAIG